MIFVVVGVLFYLVFEVTFRLLMRFVTRLWPALSPHQGGSVRASRLLLVILLHVIWILGVGATALTVVWNSTSPPDLAITYDMASFAMVIGVILMWPLMTSLEILAMSLGRPDVAVRLGTSPALSSDGLPFPPSLDPDLASAAARVEARAQPLRGDVGAVITRPGFVEVWLEAEAAVLDLERRVREHSIARKILPPIAREFVTDARERLDDLRLAAIEANVFDDAAVAAASARIAARIRS